ncbi:hypothetical protein F511_17799 [Dorcoceras hygrometricum]|uniref:HAT C-terminal dimerisation domain-containing protein n=1 Tax=Dorcoceras hygrometricum TaxID=472368 RepID=A0A2Z7BIF0_9LAMI|nr:hypothetical protein F511_17799 [Dorcoceras hygrometricum]
MFIILEEYISFDNASANTCSIDELIRLCQPSICDIFFHIRCTCHIFNLCVQDSLKILELYIRPIRSAIHYLWTHPQVMKQCGKFCKINGMRPKRYARDVPTRWNSTYKLLLSTFEYKDLLCAFLDKLFNRLIYIYIQTNGIFERLHVFFSEYLTSSDHALVECILSMKTKWENIFFNIHDFFLCAIVLDPRLKLDGLGELLTLYYDSLNPITNACPSSFMILFGVQNSLTEIYNKYNEKYGLHVGTQAQQLTTSSSITPRSKAQMLVHERTKHPRGSSSSNLELENYLTTKFDFSDVEEETFDILRWWCQKTQVYPILSLMTNEILACHVSIVAVDQAFSMRGNTLDERRSTIRLENLEAQCLLNDWSRAA